MQQTGGLIPLWNNSSHKSQYAALPNPDKWSQEGQTAMPNSTCGVWPVAFRKLPTSQKWVDSHLTTSYLWHHCFCGWPPLFLYLQVTHSGQCLYIIKVITVDVISKGYREITSLVFVDVVLMFSKPWPTFPCPSFFICGCSNYTSCAALWPLYIKPPSLRVFINAGIIKHQPYDELVRIFPLAWHIVLVIEFKDVGDLSYLYKVSD